MAEDLRGLGYRSLVHEYYSFGKETYAEYPVCDKM